MIDIDDRMAILDLCARYNYFFDTGAAQDWANTFTSDGTFDGPAGQAQGSDELVEFCTNAGKQFAGAMHFTDNHLFDGTGALIRHRCFLCLQMPSDSGTDVMLLAYEDEVAKVDGDWKFRSRRVAPLNPT
jgi:hypothetical protein